MPTASFCPVMKMVLEGAAATGLCPGCGRAVSASRAPFSSGKVASVVDTLKLIIRSRKPPPAAWLAFVTACSTPERHVPPAQSVTLDAHPVRCDFTPPVEGETLETHAPAFWRGLTVPPVVVRKNATWFWPHFYGAGKPLRLAALSGGDRSRGSGKSIMAEIATLLAGEDNARRPPSRRWNPRVNVPR